MDYISLTENILSRRRFSGVSGREVSEELLKRLHHPEHDMQIIQIAGTNGKGSTAAFLNSILQEAGFRVGMFTSPHLVRFTERIRVNGEEISESDLVDIGRQVLGTPMSNDPTMFDLCLAIALLYFKQEKVDFAILEAGLGGRLDSTTGIDAIPAVSVITRIGLDHTAYLGDTLAAIAGEKAGILKKGTRCVIGTSEKEACDVLTGTCESLGINYKLSEDTILPTDVRLGLRGLYQEENAKNALAAFEYLKKDLKLTDERYEAAVREGLMNAVWAGRMHVVSEEPFLLLDGAHNPQGIEALARSLSSEWPGESFVFLMGVLADKDYRDMIAPLVTLSECFFATNVSDAPRALPAEDLARVIKGAGGRVRTVENPIEALHEAVAEAKERGKKTVACGSLYMIGELLEELEDERVK